MLNLSLRSFPRIFLLACLSMPMAGFATDYFVRPAQGSAYGTGSGLSYANAWNSLNGISWGSLSPGDTLYICGAHSLYGDNRAIPGASGNSSNDITISGDCPTGSGTDQGAILGINVKITPGSWSSAGGGIYTASYTGCTGGFLIEEEAGGAPSIAYPGTQLDYAKDQFADPMSNQGSWTQGTFYQNGCGGTLHYKTVGGGAPTRNIYTAAGALFEITSRSYLTIRDMKLYGSYGGSGRAFELNNADHITIHNNDIQRVDVGVWIYNDSDNGVLSNNKIHETLGTAVYFTTGKTNSDTESNDDWTVSGNEIYNVSVDCKYCGLKAAAGLHDRHSIGTQGAGNRNLFEYNYIHNACCEGIVFYNWSSRTGGNVQQNNIVRYNFIRDIKDLNPRCLNEGGAWCANQRAIELGSDQQAPDPATITGNSVYGNVLLRINKLAIRAKTTKPTSGYTWSFYNNTIVDAGTAFELVVYDPDAETSSGRSGGAEFRNNIVYDTEDDSQPHIHAIVNTGATNSDTTGFSMVNNDYYADGSGKFAWGTSSTSNLAGWATLSGITESNSITTDPEFVDASDGDFEWLGTIGDGGLPATLTGQGNFQLSDTSYAIEGGVSPGDLDILGNARQGDPDIGAYEYITECL